jgi:hypothetical protein
MSVNKIWNFRNIKVITKKAERKADTKVYIEHTTKLIPVIRWSIGTLSKSFKKYLNTIYEKEQHQVARENSLTGYRANTPESTNTKMQNVYHGDAATLHTVETQLTSGTKLLIPYIKVLNNNNNNNNSFHNVLQYVH